MSRNYAIVENGLVVNVALSDEPLADNWIASDEAAIGWTYADGQFSPPPELGPTREQQEAARKKAYTNTSDPIFFMAQRGEATMEEWRIKVDEIKAAYPYPVE